MAKNSFYVTTPIYYVTAKPHLGSLYSTVLADVLARWHRLLGKDVFFLTGTDEHGQKIAQAAEKAGLQPQQFVDSFIDAYKDAWKAYYIEYSRFIRTTEPEHTKAVQEWINRLKKTGDIYKDFYTGWYCTPCETFVVEQESTTEEAPFCPSCGRPTHMVKEETYFFKLSAYQDKLLAFYQQHPDFIAPKERLNEVLSFVKAGLKDLSISRTTISWGIPFAGDAEHTVYVWADALNNYISGIGWPQDMTTCNRWWPADIQVLGKDIVRFHAIFWPAFLMAIELPMPKKLLVHGWINVNKQKMSKSLGNVVDPMMLLQSYGADAVRYYLLKQLAITHDSEFSIEDLERHIATDLANDLGNLLNRLVLLAQKYDCLVLQTPTTWSKQALDIRDESMNVVQDVQGYMDDCMFHMALARVWRYINQVNGYFHNSEPWKLVKQDTAHFVEVLAATRNALSVIATLLWPVMPVKMNELLSSIGSFDRHCEEQSDVAIQWMNKSHYMKHPTLIADLVLKSWQEKQHTLLVRPTLFEKPEPKAATEQPKEDHVEQPAISHIGIEELLKVHLVVGTISACSTVEKSDKLLKMQVDCGSYGERQILGGIRASFAPEDLIGRQALFVLNLPPRMMLGFESQGMMLIAKDVHGKTQLMSPIAPVPNGTRLQ